MKKQTCIIAANCQGAYLKALLASSPEFNERYEIHYFVNYNHELVPMPLLKSCALLIYQPLGPKWGDLASGKLLARVPQDCRTISVNYLTFPVYWPFATADARNTQNDAYPFGQFPYGDSLVTDMLAAGTPAETIIARLNERAFMASKVVPDDIINSYIAKQRDLEERRDQKVLDFVMANFRRMRIFETFNHPARPLCIFQADDILARLGMEPLKPSAVPPLTYLQDNQQPIHPVVAELLGLEFECLPATRYNIWRKPMTFDEYTRAYVHWDVSAIGSQITMAPKKPSAPAPAPPNNDPTMNIEQVVHLHIPKTAGSSLNKMLSEAYGTTESYIHYNSTLNLVKDPRRRTHPLILGHVHYDCLKLLSPNRKVFTFLREPVARTLSAFEFMKSHPETWLGKLAQGTITEFLTHPAVGRSIRDVQTRLLGLPIDFDKLYNEFTSGRIDQSEYYSRIQSLAQEQVDESSLEAAKERLKTLDFIGFTDTFDQDAPALFAILGKPCPPVIRANQTPSQFKKRDKYTEEELALVASLNRLDSQLYAFAKDLAAQRRSQACAAASHS